MSHFTVYVIVPRILEMPTGKRVMMDLDYLEKYSQVQPASPTMVMPEKSDRVADEIEAMVGQLLEPYSEELQVDEYEETCYCVGSEARHRATAVSRQVDVETLGMDARRATYQREYDADPEREAAKPDCTECGGSGIRKTRYNPKSKWDWWVIGGRWNGGIIDKPRDDDEGGFNFGDEFHQLAENMTTCSELLIRDVKGWAPFALVTPDGEWHEKAQMGWWAMTSGDKDEDVWLTEVRELVAKYPNNLIVGTDCHI